MYQIGSSCLEFRVPYRTMIGSKLKRNTFGNVLIVGSVINYSVVYKNTNISMVD